MTLKDIERNPYIQFDDYRPEEMEGRCRRVPWHRYNLPSCNAMHELDLVTNTPRFVGDGAYREVFVTNQPYMGSVEEMIFKELRWDLEMAVDDYEYVRMDAFVTERLTAHPQITDIYGYCGLSMLTGEQKYVATRIIIPLNISLILILILCLETEFFAFGAYYFCRLATLDFKNQCSRDLVSISFLPFTNLPCRGHRKGRCWL
jgi:hypothetical protein